jgi:hypothetical protein
MNKDKVTILGNDIIRKNRVIDERSDTNTIHG